MSVFVQVPLLGVIENMSRMEMPLLQLLETLQLGENKDAEKARAALIAAAKSSGFESSAVGVPLFAAADGPATCVSAMAERLGVEFLGAIPHDPNLLAASESGIRLADLAPHSAASAPLDVVLEGVSKARVSVTVFLGHSRPPRLSDQTEEAMLCWVSFVVLRCLSAPPQACACGHRVAVRTEVCHERGGQNPCRRAGVSRIDRASS